MDRCLRQLASGVRFRRSAPLGCASVQIDARAFSRVAGLKQLKCFATAFSFFLLVERIIINRLSVRAAESKWFSRTI